MAHVPQIKIPATYMRGGTSKGVFFNLTDLPKRCQVAGSARDNMLLRVIGSPDPYGKQTDGMGGATSSTSKTVILSKSEMPEHDVDYLFGQVAIDKAFVDWSGNCGNLTAAVGSFAINAGLVESARIPENGVCTVRIWQKNIAKTIIANVPIVNGEVQETGDFELDGVTFPAAEVPVEFVSPVDPSEAMFPTGNVKDVLQVPASGTFDSIELEVTMISAGIPTIFINAKDIGYQGTELQDAINNDEAALERFEVIRSHGAMKMGLISDISEAADRQHTPKIAFVSSAKEYTTSSGKNIQIDEIDLNVRALSMGKLHHAMMGTAAVAIGAAAAIPGTIVALAASKDEKQKAAESVTFGHPSGVLKVGAKASKKDGCWLVDKAMMSRSARILMEGWVRIPEDSF
ncbi:2-methylaconitate cis-trans isomerase PrpF [Thalassotalea sp. SU-HH00458]|uniref:2-methylaconitate cis-trans isomerase PrpF n=1 Tax=Thalassotalea sp. SU-HH00458 TaxID=3127657 RepID=UPI0031047846